ncbi:MAG TPA: GerMN domain-containing protein [Actinomycetota bacterium]|nr:GerMN domain-containing protein [Actinomycetota bacterium]
MNTRVNLLFLVVALLAGAVGCGVPVDDRAERLNDVPFGLLESESPEPAETAPPAEGPLVQIYLLDPSGQQLVPVERRLAPAEAPLFAVMDALLTGPTRAELRQGLSTAFADENAVARVDLVGGVASVDLTQQFTVLDGPTQRLAIAQMVLTLTGRPGVGRVAFTLEGQPIDIPRGDGTLVAGSVSRDSYRELVPGG